MNDNGSYIMYTGTSDRQDSSIDLEEFKGRLKPEDLELFELGIIGEDLMYTSQAEDIADRLNLLDRLEEVKEVRREEIKKEEAKKKK